MLTERQIVESIAVDAADVLEIKVRDDGWIVMSRRDLEDSLAFKWKNPRKFLFSTARSASFFDIADLVAVPTKIRGRYRCLKDCRSLEELELKMTILGLVDCSRKTLERKEDD